MYDVKLPTALLLRTFLHTSVQERLARGKNLLQVITPNSNCCQIWDGGTVVDLHFRNLRTGVQSLRHGCHFFLRGHHCSIRMFNSEILHERFATVIQL
jgi:hypothetical protein